MLGMLLMAIADIRLLLATADVTAALSVEALLGTDQVFLPELHAALRPHPGQAASADNMLRVLSNSPIVASHRINDTKVQDAYSLRCAPQVAGAVRDTVDHAALVASRELAAAIDNPVVLPDGRVTSNGNFHGAPVAYVLDFLAIAVADLSSIAERRTDRMLDPARSHGLPAFLAGTRASIPGLMIAQYTQAGLVSDNKRLAVPASVDSIPSSAMQEDHVSMGWHAARKLRRPWRTFAACSPSSLSPAPAPLTCGPKCPTANSPRDPPVRQCLRCFAKWCRVRAPIGSCRRNWKRLTAWLAPARSVRPPNPPSEISPKTETKCKRCSKSHIKEAVA
jgi:histidine ammonia-lyase